MDDATADADPTGHQAAHLTAFGNCLVGAGYTAQPLNLRVEAPDGRAVVITCMARPEDAYKLWFWVPMYGRWLAEADQPTWALTELKRLLGEVRTEAER